MENFQWNWEIFKKEIGTLLQSCTSSYEEKIDDQSLSIKAGRVESCIEYQCGISFKIFLTC